MIPKETGTVKPSDTYGNHFSSKTAKIRRKSDGKVVIVPKGVG